MTMLAEFLAHHGYQVSGSDTDEKFMTDKVLAKSGIEVFEGFSSEHVRNDVDVIIRSIAWNASNNEEVAAAEKNNVPLITYGEALSEVFNTHYGIAVCGSHGKTTTSAWLGYVMDRAGLKPNVMSGAAVPQFGGAGISGDSNLLVVEADEYQNKLQYLNPKMILLNNIEYDHPDFFPSMKEYTQVFIDFISRLPKSGTLIANYDDAVLRDIAKRYGLGKTISYGMTEEADYQASDVRYQNGKQFFKVSIKRDEKAAVEEGETFDLGTFSISLSGKHNIYNALAVIAASLELGVELLPLRQHLAEFGGTERRMQLLGSFKGADIIDDYAHHPTEIKATLEAMKQQYGDKKIRVVFHPHTFTRTKSLLKEFGQSFAQADEVIVLDIYGSAREEQGGISGQEVAEEIIQAGQKNTRYIPTLEAVENYLRETANAGQVILLVGAGDVFRIGERLIL